MTMKRLSRSLLKKNIEGRINDDVASGRVGGAAVIVRQDGEVVYKNCFGHKTPGTDDTLTENATFRLASMTKPITAAAVLIQIDRGLISLDDPVEKFIPEYADMSIGGFDSEGKIVEFGKAKEKVRVIHLLTHSSGIGTMDVGTVQYAIMPAEQRKTLKGVVDYHANMYLAFEPMSAQFYSAVVGFDVLARLVEITSGKPFDEFLKKEIFKPLGMCDTTFAPTEEQWERMIVMHDFSDGEPKIGSFTEGCVFAENATTYFCGGAGLMSTLDDYSRFAEMLLNKGKAPDGRQLISERLITEMGTPHLPRDIMPDPQVWGLGVRVITDESYKLLPVGCYGWSGAYGTHFWVDPENRITAVYMKNSNYDGGSGAITAAHFEEDVSAALEG